MKVKQCRVCLGIGIMSSIFEVEDNSMISLKIMSLSKVRIYPGDGFPDTICRLCISRLNSSIEFINLCQVSDLKLRKAATEKDELEIISQTVVNTDVSTGSDNDIERSQKFKSLEDSQLISNVKSTSCARASEVIGCISNDCNAKSKEEKKVITSKVNKTQQQCNFCGRVMSSRHRLKTHLVTHTGERPYSCPHCKKSFSLTANLKVHLRVHTGEKPFQCSFCGKTFAQTSGLITHKRKHTGQAPYKCLLCARSFRTIGHLQYHTKRHTGEKKFECDQCQRAFITRGDLNQHLTTHFSDRHYVCSICGMRLTRAFNLKRHMQQLHSNSTNIKKNLCLDSKTTKFTC